VTVRRRPSPPTGLRRTPLSRRRSVRLLALVASIAVLVGAPVLVVLLASTESVTASAPEIRPGSTNPLKPSAPFLQNAGNGITPDAIRCSAAGTPVAVRARAHLDVLADGARVTIPAGIGVLPTCRYWLSTSRPDGVVEILSPERRAFTLGDLFDIWGAPLGPDRVLTFRTGPARPLRLYVDGRRETGDPRAVRLSPGREIAVVVGRLSAVIPSRFDFSRVR
jgi:hypothetical protein